MTRRTDAPLTELLAGAAAGDLESEEREALAGLAVDPSDRENFSRVAALVQLAFAMRDPHASGSLSEAARARLAQRATAWSRRRFQP